MEIKRETINGIKLQLILNNIVTPAAHFKLEEEINFQSEPDNAYANCVSKFLEVNYNNCLKTKAQDDFVRTLNPDFPKPRSNKPFPNDLKLFTISSCFQIAKLLRLPQEILKVF